MKQSPLLGLESPILLKGDATTAYRDPTAVYHEGTFHLFFTLMKTEADGKVFSYLATSRSSDLKNWSPAEILTPRDAALNFGSPGNVVRFEGEWIICLQTYPRPNGEKYGNGNSRLWTMRSSDLKSWTNPEILRVKGPGVPIAEMGRMIDPYLLEDKDEPGKWWCFWKQNGVSMAHSNDLKMWEYVGHVEGGENVCLLTQSDEYVMLHSPQNGIGIKRSPDLLHWRDEALLTLGQNDWEWAKGRITAGFALDLRADADFGKYVMFFHGSGPEDEEVIFDTHACIGIAWSDDLLNWEWPDSVVPVTVS